MRKRVTSLGLFFLALLILSLCVLAKIRLNGDGGEYLLVTHALFHHGSVAIRPEDIDEIRKLPVSILGRMNFPSEMYEQLQVLFQTPHAIPWDGFASVVPNRYYSIHFWMYSLLAVPFYAVLYGLGLNPVWALGLLNLSFAGAVLVYLRRIMPQHARLAFVLFLAMGTTFYLGWTGPEAMCASCALIASIAILRGEVGLAVLLCGIAASQNPSLVFMIPAAIGFRLLLGKWPQLAWPGSTVQPVGMTAVLVTLAGITLALLPYAFFQFVFGVPSLTGAYFTSPSLITVNRFISLVCDLDQGMMIGVPGLFAALFFAVFMIAAPQRRRWLVTALAVIVMVVVMAIPTLAATNWNSGCVVMLRYAYWLAMPLLALVLLSLQLMPERLVIRLAILALALQGVVFAEYGVLGRRGSPLEHSMQAEWMFKHFPAYYNPDAEIFYERSVGSEDAMPLSLTYLYRPHGVPLKLLRHASNLDASAGLCPAGQRLQGQDLRTVDSGWQYANPPFHCQPISHSEQLGAWEINAAHPTNRALLTSGWSFPEAQCIWTEGSQSVITLPVPIGDKALRIRTQGFYYGRQNSSALTVNGRRLADFNLTDGVVDLPDNLPAASKLVIGLQHDNTASPKSLGESLDPRQLGFCLKSIRVDTVVH